jgi:hypothetical protein
MTTEQAKLQLSFSNFTSVNGYRDELVRILSGDLDTLGGADMRSVTFSKVGQNALQNCQFT